MLPTNVSKNLKIENIFSEGMWQVFNNFVFSINIYTIFAFISMTEISHQYKMYLSNYL